MVVGNVMRDFVPALLTREMTTVYENSTQLGNWLSGVQCLLSKCGDLSSNSSTRGYYRSRVLCVCNPSTEETDTGTPCCLVPASVANC